MSSQSDPKLDRELDLRALTLFAVVADAVVASGREGDLELRPDTIRARHQDGPLVAVGIEPEEPAEAPDIGERPRLVGRAGRFAYFLKRFRRRVDIDACGSVVHGQLLYGPCSRSFSSPRTRNIY